MTTKTLATLLCSAMVLVSANAALACGRSYGLGDSFERSRFARASRHENQSRLPAPLNIATERPPAAQSQAAGLSDSTL